MPGELHAMVVLDHLLLPLVCFRLHAAFLIGVEGCSQSCPTCCAARGPSSCHSGDGGRLQH